MNIRKGVFILLLITGLIACDNTANTLAKESSTPADFSLPNLDGDIRSLKAWQGKFIVLNFWATWCPPCREEIPSFIALQEQYSSAGLQFVGIAIDDEMPVQAFAMEMGINYPILIAQTDGIDLALQYGNMSGALPFSVLINPDGKIVARHFGILKPEEIIKITKLAKN